MFRNALKCIKKHPIADNCPLCAYHTAWNALFHFLSKDKLRCLDFHHSFAFSNNQVAVLHVTRGKKKKHFVFCSCCFQWLCIPSALCGRPYINSVNELPQKCYVVFHLYFSLLVFSHAQDILNNLDNTGSCDLEDDDLMLDVDLPEDGTLHNG